jgi:hypothetical protein
MEKQLLELFPDENVRLQDYRSFVNQPERIQISSFDDINDYDPNTLTSYFNFRVRLPRPALNVKSLQLARASIPNCTTNIPDSECTFWYYTLPFVSVGSIYEDNPASPGTPGDLKYTFDEDGNVYDAVTNVLQDITEYQVYFEGEGDDGTGTLRMGGINYTYNRITAQAGNVDVACTSAGDLDWWINYANPVIPRPRINFLRYVRLLPSFVQPELLPVNNFGFNRTFVDYQDLLTELENAVNDDPLFGQVSNSELGNFKFVPNQIVFEISQRFNKFLFTRNTTGVIPTNIWTYLPAASDDPLLIQASLELQERDKQNSFDFGGTIELIQPFQIYRYLNQRLGFNYATYPPGINFNNMCRPIPPYLASPPNLGDFSTYDHIAPGYADLVYSACCNIYCDVAGGSTVDTLVSKALLASVPLNTPNLGVGFHSLPLNNPLTKIVSQIYEIYIELRTDSGQPFLLGNNAIVSLEFILTY